ncbi:MAG: hypothetical protein JW768_02260 [Chitinispirillaceae bacterium]|nr:hypothetical protein [Chitinispirillaceae bacterium]
MNQTLLRSTILITALFVAVTSTSAGWLKIKPLIKEKVAVTKSTVDPRMVYRFFDEDFVSGGYAYWYPDDSKVFIPEESGKNGEVALQFDLDAQDYSGGSVCLYNLLYDLRPYYSRGALQFWIKGKNGGEIAWAALVDEENSDGKKTVVRLPMQNYGGIAKEWKQITIPLADFGKRGVYWDAKKRVEVPERFAWNAVAEFRVEIKKNDNPSFRIWVDDIFILQNVFEAREEVKEVYWDERQEKIAPPPDKRPAVKDAKVLFDNAPPAGAFAYVYGGKTAYKVMPSTSTNNSILACYLDNNDYSGVTLALGAGASHNLEPLRKAKAAGVAFWAKGGAGTSAIYIGLIDDESDGKKVQTKVALGDFGQLDTTWKYFMIPLRRFQSTGKYWDENKKAEVVDDIKWNQFNEIRFSNNKGENKVPEGEPVAIYVDRVSFIEDIPGYVDPEQYWAAFKSDAPDVMLHDFETGKDTTWEMSKGPKSEVAYEIVKSDAPKGGNGAMKITFKMNDWCDVVYRYKDRNRPEKERDWTKHWGIKFNMYTSKAYQALNLQVNDGGNEIFIASCGGQKGWSEVLVPFKTFYKFPYWQPPDAVQNGKFDLKEVMAIDFKPSGEGTAGVFIVDNVRLTNEREVKAAPVPEKIALTVKGDLAKTIVPQIKKEIFGINVALWDGDLLKPKTADYVKAVNHHVLRYPGGLRADEDHWKEVLAKKDWMVDTDEFLAFCKKTGTTPMITVNFGTGTADEAAEWVKHVNVTKKAGVKYWEVGNELYGDWHANHCSAEEYGKRAAEFIKKMKAVDSSILVTVVWVLEGDWNKTVFKHTKDCADGVIVHHYPQHAGEENDAGLLAAPASLNEILPAVRKQIEAYGTPGKKYEIWLTEWNSVDFKPGPQTLGIVNGLFVADYLAVLARNDVDHADYWDVHNDMTEQGGDYGYLSRTGAPDGDNVPRPSYWAFKLASESLRGKMVESATGKEEVTSYLTVNGGKKTLLLINKMPRTKAELTITIPNFNGKGTVRQLTSENAKKGYSAQDIEVKQGMKFTLPSYSITAITVE